MSEIGAHLARLDKATKVLAEVSTASEAWQLARTAEAARRYAQLRGLGTEAVNYATVVKARAMILLADFVDAGQADGSIRTAEDGRSKGVLNGNALPLADVLETDSLAARKAVFEARRTRDALAGADIDALVAEANASGVDFGLRGLRMAAAELFPLLAGCRGIHRTLLASRPVAGLHRRT